MEFKKILSLLGLLGCLCSIGSPSLAAGVAQIKTSYFHTCTVLNTGAIECWGYNAYGQLGTVDDIKATAIAAGGLHTCAVLNTGAIKCWGYGAYGQLGNGTTQNSTTPVDVANLEGMKATAIAAGEYHTCAVFDTGAIKCWGHGASGKLGNQTTGNSATPVDVANLDGMKATAIVAGEHHTCAMFDTGAIKCWGNGSSGQLGHGNTQNSTMPVDVTGLAGIKAIDIDAGIHHTCAVLDTGGAKCWGFNNYGQLGNHAQQNSLVPVDVANLEALNVTDIAAGYSHTCAVFDSGEIKCWGYGASGRLGTGTTQNSLTPVNVINLDGLKATAITAGVFHTCATFNTGEIKCWGENRHGQLGNHTVQSSATPVSAVLPESCFIYAVNDKDLNTSQFFSIDLGSNIFTINSMGEEKVGADIEALAIHVTGVTYITSGDDTTEGYPKGQLYSLDVNTGKLHNIGATGFAEVSALTINPNNAQVLWGWADGEGLIEIDITTGTGELKLASPHRIEDMVLSADGKSLYGVAGTVLYELDIATLSVTRKCNHFPSEVEAIAVMNASSLVFALHDEQDTNVYSFDLDTCSASIESVAVTGYSDIEGIAFTKGCHF